MNFVKKNRKILTSTKSRLDFFDLIVRKLLQILDFSNWSHLVCFWTDLIQIALIKLYVWWNEVFRLANYKESCIHDSFKMIKIMLKNVIFFHQWCFFAILSVSLSFWEPHCSVFHDVWQHFFFDFLDKYHEKIIYKTLKLHQKMGK